MQLSEMTREQRALVTGGDRDTDVWIRELNFDIGTFGKTTKSKNPSIVRGVRYHNNIYKLLQMWQKISAPTHVLHIEPWLRNLRTRRMLQPDAVVVDPDTNTGIAIEIKLNWKDGRDLKLEHRYIRAVQVAFGLECVWPALITKNVQYLPANRKPRLGLGALLTVDDWQPGQDCPVILVP